MIREQEGGDYLMRANQGHTMKQVKEDELLEIVPDDTQVILMSCLSFSATHNMECTHEQARSPSCKSDLPIWCRLLCRRCHIRNKYGKK